MPHLHGHAWNAPPLPTPPHSSRPSHKQLLTFHLNHEALRDLLRLLFSGHVSAHALHLHRAHHSGIIYSSSFRSVIPKMASVSEDQRAQQRHPSRRQAHSIPGLSAGGVSKSRICGSLIPTAHRRSRVLRRGQLEVLRAETADQEQPASRRSFSPGGVKREAFSYTHGLPAHSKLQLTS